MKTQEVKDKIKTLHAEMGVIEGLMEKEEDAEKKNAYRVDLEGKSKQWDMLKADLALAEKIGEPQCSPEA